MDNTHLHNPEDQAPQPSNGSKSLKDIRWKTPQFIIFTVVFALIGSFLLIRSFAAEPTNDGSVDEAFIPTATKKLKPVSHHKDKKVCGDVAKNSNQVRCLARILVDDNGNPLISKTKPNALNGAPGYGPQEFHTAYNLPCTPGGQVQSVCTQPASFGPTVAIVDAYDIGDRIESDLAIYNQEMGGLPACTKANGCLTIVNQNGQTSPLPANYLTATDDQTRNAAQLWSMEAYLDIEAVHMTCQTCKILLVESNTNSFADMASAENTAATFHPVAISNSFSSIFELSSAAQYNSAYIHPGIAVVVSSGDGGGNNPENYPDVADVIGVGGTTLQLNTDSTWANESWWNPKGGWGCADPNIGGPETRAPIWQTNLPNWKDVGWKNVNDGGFPCSTGKSIADVSADADPNTGMAVFSTWPAGGGWGVDGGTSLSAPIIGGIFGLTGGPPAGYSHPAYIPYSAFNSTNSHNITDDHGRYAQCQSLIGTNQACEYNTEGMLGYDMLTGLGTPNGISGFVANGQPPTGGGGTSCSTTTADTTPPTAATNLSAAIASSTSATISWQAATDNVCVTGYDIYRGSTKVATIQNALTYQDNALRANTSYTYYVIAFDAAGNRSAKSAALALKTPTLSTTNGSVTGRVTDIVSGKPLNGAKVYYVLGGRNKSVSTNSSGYYVINNLPPAAYNLTYSLTNYQTQAAPVSTTAATNTTQNIGLYHL